ncbi:MAG: Stp1/IreP family PP2C-type Ser/Thr phosphatase [Proteobacteria bacterium]|nr:Stp1/IreP family PP2C-type Ser/Thr phosphatase [Pseudomonadota bacterium]MCZ6782467.1 Stp1/IreP family PP2C-type Ser/Thr phosphatase [Pseudomonadota bacterium]
MPLLDWDPTQVEVAERSDVGQVRKANQDAVAEVRAAQPEIRALIVADGMGGHRGGEVASRLAVETLTQKLETGAAAPEEALRVGFETANARVYEAGGRDPALLGMGTTLVCLLLDASGGAWVGHVGDSRAYRLRDGRLELLTDDHSVVGELLRAGRISSEEARVHPQRNELLRAIGTQPTVLMDVQSVEVRAGDRFLLCSDGLTSMVPDSEIAEIAALPELERAAQALVDRANAEGGLDNVTVQLVRIPGIGAAASGTRALGWWIAAGASALALGLWWALR